MINHILNHLLDKGEEVFIDDVLIYAKTKEKHDLLVKGALKRLVENQ
jgi:hypothetical protein